MCGTDVPLIEQAARVNAEWCEAVARGHGVRSRFTLDAWMAASRTPQNYPDAVTLRRSATSDILAGVDVSAGCSVKDSFCALDLRAYGFEVLLEARWIFRAPAPELGARPVAAANAAAVVEGAVDGDGESDGDLVWERIDSTSLGDWSALQGSPDTFRSSLLAEPGVVILAARSAGRLAAGAVLSHTGAVVGISNVVWTGVTSSAGVWRGLSAQTAVLFPGLTMVGYESGADLIAPLDAGFAELGDLRIWGIPSGEG